MNNYKQSKYHYFYKITNLINNHFYYGVHNTDNLNDGYMGSEKRLNFAYKKYGIENFTKEILKYFNTAKEAFEYEAEIVNEQLVNDNNCYNLKIGGCGGIDTRGKIVVKDKNENTFSVSIDDSRYLSGEFVSVSKGFVVVKDKDENIYRVSITDDKYISGELVHIQVGYCMVFDKNGVAKRVKVNDPLLLSGEYIPIQKGYVNAKDETGKYKKITREEFNTGKYLHPTKGRVTVKDSKGNFYSVYKNDPRYLSGELKPNCCGHVLSEEIKEKISKNMPDISGEKNPNFGKIWIHKNSENKIINKSEFEYYSNIGWKKGRFLEKDEHGKIKKKK